MCFNKEMSLGFTFFSVIAGSWIISGRGMWNNVAKWRLVRISSCFYYFAFMEFLQFLQYLVIDECNAPINVFWTVLGWLHICFQPLFSNLAFSALDNRNNIKQRDETWKFILKFCFASGFLMSLRIIIPIIYENSAGKYQSFLKMCNENIEGVCGQRTCSETGNYHIKWTFKMIKPSYPFPGLAVHFLNMFITPIIMGQCFGSIALFMTGPMLALFFDVSDGERASILCFFSIMETAVTAFTQYLACVKAIKQNKKPKANK